MLQLMFNPGLTLTGFRTTRPRWRGAKKVTLFLVSQLRRSRHRARFCSNMNFLVVVMLSCNVEFQRNKTIQHWYQLQCDPSLFWLNILASSRTSAMMSPSVADGTRSCLCCMLNSFTIWELNSDIKDLFWLEWSITNTLAYHYLFSG